MKKEKDACKLEKILEKLSAIEIKQAVTHSELAAIVKARDEEKKELKSINKKVNRHDAIVAALVIVCAIVGGAAKYNLI